MTARPGVPALRVRGLNRHEARRDGAFVLYWMTAFRRARWSFSLDRALEWCRELGLPLVVLEGVRCDAPWASARTHQFVAEGMRDNALAFERAGVPYHPYLERTPGAARGLLEALAAHAGVVVTDDWPGLFLPRMATAAADRASVRFEAVDSNGLLPLGVTDRVFSTAHSFRRLVQRELPEHLAMPTAGPLARWRQSGDSALFDALVRPWPALTSEELARAASALEGVPLDRDVHAVPEVATGGSRAGQALVKRFVERALEHYGDRNHPDAEVTSGLSPYLHFGHVSPHEILHAIGRREGWSPSELEPGDGRGSREGWWGLSSASEGFLDQLVTWRELGFHTAARMPDYDRYEALPEWARATLDEHASDPREHVYTHDDFEAARTHDELWNAAQTQLVREGRMHNYLRMLWGKKVLEWSPSPRAALETLIELNNRWALDGRDPNSISGIFWVLGRFDRPWGPKRPVFGSVRFMSSANTAKKLRVRDYVRRYAREPESLFPASGRGA